MARFVVLLTSARTEARLSAPARLREIASDVLSMGWNLIKTANAHLFPQTEKRQLQISAVIMSGIIL